MEEKYYALGAGRLYIAPWETPEAEVRSLKWYAGQTKGGVTLAYTAKEYEVRGWGGELQRTVRYGGKIRLTGKFARLYPRVIAAATGAPVSDSAILLGGKGEAGTARVRVILVSEIPESAGGGEVVFSMRAGASSGMSVHFSPERDSAWDFSLTAESDDAGVSGKLVLR
ncbi:MAG: hypothetical protein IJZ08_00035 [Clostridia bacterium]|nr:hypothetical protein [Clostridia bacterium]